MGTHRLLMPISVTLARQRAIKEAHQQKQPVHSLSRSKSSMQQPRTTEWLSPGAARQPFPKNSSSSCKHFLSFFFFWFRTRRFSRPTQKTMLAAQLWCCHKHFSFRGMQRLDERAQIPTLPSEVESPRIQSFTCDAFSKPNWEVGR